MEKGKQKLTKLVEQVVNISMLYDIPIFVVLDTLVQIWKKRIEKKGNKLNQNSENQQIIKLNLKKINYR
ncbi:MAG: hypothetical protein ACTSUV_02055 [Candidatus Ranarchaeia archaeon]